MHPLIIIGAVIFLGLLLGEVAFKMRLPKITGYILAGIVFNPQFLHIIPRDISGHSGIITTLALSFITFSVGGTLFYPRIKNLGKGIVYITVLEAEFAFLAVIAGFLIFSPIYVKIPQATLPAVFLPLALLMGVLASPTDPSATLAVIHEYKARGPVSSTIMGVAAMDDIMGILNYSVGISIAGALVMHNKLNAYSFLWEPLLSILGAVVIGALFGFVFNIFTGIFKREAEGFFIVLIFSLLPLCFGITNLLRCAELLAIMAMGIVVVNFNPKKDKIFRVLERYTEELVFVIFFAIGGMQLDFSVLRTYFPLVLVFIAFRLAGKIAGTLSGALLSKSGPKVTKYTAGGLVPQGGIVIGLALLIKQNPAFSGIADIIVSIAIGTAVIQELIGPVISELALKMAGEIRKPGTATV